MKRGYRSAEEFSSEAAYIPGKSIRPWICTSPVTMLVAATIYSVPTTPMHAKPGTDKNKTKGTHNKQSLHQFLYIRQYFFQGW